MQVGEFLIDRCCLHVAQRVLRVCVSGKAEQSPSQNQFLELVLYISPGSSTRAGSVAPTPCSCAAKTDVITLTCDASHVNIDISHMMTAAQLRAARALVGMDQRDLAAASGLSLPTIQRMEASEGVIRGNVDSLMKLIAALEAAGVELINEGAPSAGGGRGVRLKEP